MASVFGASLDINWSCRANRRCSFVCGQPATTPNAFCSSFCSSFCTQLPSLVVICVLLPTSAPPPDSRLASLFLHRVGVLRAGWLWCRCGYGCGPGCWVYAGHGRRCIRTGRRDEEHVCPAACPASARVHRLASTPWQAETSLGDRLVGSPRWLTPLSTVNRP